jgi:hypothetical protein
MGKRVLAAHQLGVCFIILFFLIIQRREDFVFASWT